VTLSRTDQPQIVYTDDADASVRFRARDRNGEDLDFTVKVAYGSAAYVDGSWEGATPSPERVFTAPAANLDEGLHNVYLQVPGGADMLVGRVLVKARD
jgi:hypothetical protein